VSEDPIGFISMDRHIARYIFNNPVLRNDPMGLMGSFSPVVLPIIRGVFEVAGIVITTGTISGIIFNPSSPSIVSNGASLYLGLTVSRSNINESIHNSFNAITPRFTSHTWKWAGIYVWAVFILYEDDFYSPDDYLGTYSTGFYKHDLSDSTGMHPPTSLDAKFGIELKFTNVNGKAKVSAGSTTVGDNDCTVGISAELKVFFMAVDEYSIAGSTEYELGSIQENSSGKINVTYKVNK
jgi:hypothetical protein